MRTVFLSDSHGYLEQVKMVLADLGLTDTEGNWVAGKRARLVHHGDYVDRGPNSVETYRYFSDLQKQLGEQQVIRLAGNHDTQYFGGMMCGVEPKIMLELADEMENDVKEGKLKFAHVFDDEQEGPWLCVHGGLDPQWEKLHEMEIHALAEHLNKLGQEMVTEGKLHPEIGGVDAGRGGWDKIAGITWCDVEDNLKPNEDKISHRQIVGHRQQPDGANLSRGGKLWAINVPYGLAQALVFDSGVGFTTSRVATQDHGLAVIEGHKHAEPLVRLSSLDQEVSQEDLEITKADPDQTHDLG